MVAAAPSDGTGGKRGRCPSPAAGTLRILLAEDNSINQKVACGILRNLGHGADIAANGEQVLAALETAAYDLIFMDCQMPVMDGFEATRRVRAAADPAAGHHRHDGQRASRRPRAVPRRRAWTTTSPSRSAPRFSRRRSDKWAACLPRPEPCSQFHQAVMLSEAQRSRRTRHAFGRSKQMEILSDSHQGIFPPASDDAPKLAATHTIRRGPAVIDRRYGRHRDLTKPPRQLSRRAGRVLI